MVFSAGDGIPRRGRPPRPTVESGAVSYDADAGCFVGAKGMYWLGTANGGWSKQPKGEKPAMQAKDKASTESEDQRPAKRAKADESEAGSKKKPKGRPPVCHPQLGTLSYDLDLAVWKTDRGYFWSGSEQLGGDGWTRKLPKKS